MVHKSSLIPGLSKFIDENVLAHYPATSIKRIVMAGAVSLYLKKNEGLLETWIHNPLFTGLGIMHENGMVDIDCVRDTLKSEINKAGFMRVSIPFIGDIDFTADDADALHKYIVESYTTATKLTIPSPQPQTILGYNGGGIY